MGLKKQAKKFKQFVGKPKPTKKGLKLKKKLMYKDKDGFFNKKKKPSLLDL